MSVFGVFLILIFPHLDRIRDSRNWWCNLFWFMKTRPEVIKRKQTGLRVMQISSKVMSATNISKFLLQNMNEPFLVETQIDKALTWGKSLLSALPIFTRIEIDLHVRKCCKLNGKFMSKISVMLLTYKADRSWDYFKFVIEKINDYYKDYYINEWLSRANNE